MNYPGGNIKKNIDIYILCIEIRFAYKLNRER